MRGRHARHVDDPSRGHGGRQNMQRLFSTKEKRADLQAAGRRAQQGQGDVGCVEARHHQQICRRSEGALSDVARERGRAEAPSACISPSTRSGTWARRSIRACLIFRADGELLEPKLE